MKTPILPLVVAGALGTVLGRECWTFFRRKQLTEPALPPKWQQDSSDSDDEVAEIIKRALPALERARRSSTV